MRVVLCVLLLTVLVQGESPPAPVPVYVERLESDDGKFTDLLKVELAKRKGLIKATVDIVRFPEQARYIIETNVTYRKGKWHEGWLTPSKAETMATAFAYDQCGKLVWSKTKGDMTLMGSGGAVLAAQKMAASFKEALAKKKSRLNRAAPCEKAAD